MKYTIVKNTERYEGISPSWPEEFFVEGMTLEQAIELAEELSYMNAGCDYSFYVKEDPDAQ